MKPLDWLHAKYGARVDSDPITEELPAGWSIRIREWGPQSFDALITPPPGTIGWRLGGEFAKTKSDAALRAAEEIAAHINRTRQSEAT